MFSNDPEWVEKRYGCCILENHGYGEEQTSHKRVYHPIVANLILLRNAGIVYKNRSEGEIRSLKFTELILEQIV
jgi:hypothetical protein